jgi:hypothetical protein
LAEAGAGLSRNGARRRAVLPDLHADQEAQQDEPFARIHRAHRRTRSIPVSPDSSMYATKPTLIVRAQRGQKEGIRRVRPLSGCRRTRHGRAVPARPTARRQYAATAPTNSAAEAEGGALTRQNLRLTVTDDRPVVTQWWRIVWRDRRKNGAPWRIGDPVARRFKDSLPPERPVLASILLLLVDVVLAISGVCFFLLIGLGALYLCGGLSPSLFDSLCFIYLAPGLLF